MDSRRIRQIGNGVLLSRFRIDAATRQRTRRELGIPEGRPIVGTVCRLSPDKNVESILAALGSVRSRRPGTTLVVVGDGPHRNALEQRARSLGCEDAVLFCGSRRDVPELLAVFDLFVLTSRREGLPMVILEAMAAARPVLSTPVGAIPTVIRHGDSGILLDGTDPESLAREILELLDDPERARSLGRRALSTVTERFSTGKMVDDYLCLYSEALGRQTR